MNAFMDNCVFVNIFVYECDHGMLFLLTLALGYGLDDRDSTARFPAGVGNFSLHHGVQNGSGAHPASYPVGTSGSFLGGKAAGT
jgi:hypothetical protein